MRDGAHSAGSPLTMARERHLLALTEAGDRAATEELVTAFMPAINGVANRYRSFRSLERRELQQEGVVGLLRAARRYDQRYETPFWAYALWWVRQAMQQLVAELTSPVALSDRAARSLVQMKRARAAFAQANRREPSDSELAETARMPLDQVQHLVSVERAPSSLQAPHPATSKGRRPSPSGSPIRPPRRSTNGSSTWPRGSTSRNSPPASRSASAASSSLTTGSAAGSRRCARSAASPISVSSG